MKLSIKSRLFRGLTQALAALLVLCIGITSIATEWASKVNDVLGTTSYKFISSGEGTGDTTYFKSDYNTAEELIEAREGLIRRTVGEGAVLLKNENNALPLAQGSKVTLFGISSYHSDFSATSGGSSFDTTLATRLPKALDSVGLTTNPVVNEFYAEKGAEMTETGVNAWTGQPTYDFTYRNRPDSLGEIPVSEYTQDMKASYSQYGDAAVVVFARMTGEGTTVFE